MERAATSNADGGNRRGFQKLIENNVVQGHGRIEKKGVPL